MAFHVILELLVVLKGGAAQFARKRLVSGVGPPDVAVVGGVRGEGLPAVLALERPLPGVLADVCAQDAGGSEGLEGQTSVQSSGFGFNGYKFFCLKCINYIYNTIAICYYLCDDYYLWDFNLKKRKF